MRTECLGFYRPGRTVGVTIAALTGFAALMLSAAAPGRAGDDARPAIVAITPDGFTGGIELPASVEIAYTSSDDRPPTAIRFGGVLACGDPLDGCPRPTGRRPNLMITVPVPEPPPLPTEVTAPTTGAVCVQVELADTEASPCHGAFGAGGPPRAITPCPATAPDAASFCYAITPGPAVEPFPDPGDGLTDAGTPGDPPPPDGATGALGPGSPDTGAAPPTTESERTCQLHPELEQRLCFALDGATRFEVSNPSVHDLAIVERHADSTVLRTTPLTSLQTRVISFMQNTTVTVVNQSGRPRESTILVRFANARESQDFLCEVPVHNPYVPSEWRNHAKCTWTAGNSWLAAFHNYGDRPVEMNEWYGESRHGRTEIRPGETKIIPLHSQGTFWVGVGGAPRPPIKVSVTDYRVANALPEMWVRDTAQYLIPDGLDTAVNLSPYRVGLEWFLPEFGAAVLDPDQRVGIPLAQRRYVYASKQYGTGAVARVLFLPPHWGSDEIYRIAAPHHTDPMYPFATMTWVGRLYRHVRVENLGPHAVSLSAWSLPFLVQTGDIRLKPGDSQILPLFTDKAAVLITALVHAPEPGSFAQVKATEWTPCPARGCATLVTATVTSLTGNASRVGDGAADAGQVKMSGRFTFAPSDENLDLSRAGVTLQSLLAEAGTAGELVDGIASGPVRLVARPGSKSTSAVLESQPEAGRPSFRLEVKQRSAGVLEFKLKVDGAVLSYDPGLCSAARPSTTSLTTRFVISDGQHPPVAVAAQRAWECVGRQPQTPSELRLR